MRRPSARSIGRALPVVAIVGVLGYFLVRNDELPSFPHYDAPEGFTPSPAPTTPPEGATLPALAAVDGTTTTAVPANVGSAQLTGLVTGPDGAAVAGATVHIERAIGGTLQVLDVATGPDGRYAAGGIGGGRYRVRAFAPPTLAGTQAEVFFLVDGDTKDLPLTMAGFDGPAVQAAAAPSPLLLGQAANVVVRVTGRFVDTQGIVRLQALSGGLVDASLLGALQRVSPPGTLATDGDGEVVIAARCVAVGPSQVQASVRATADAVPTTFTVDLPDCVDPASLTTTTSTTPDGSSSTTTPDGSSSTSSSSTSSTSTSTSSTSSTSTTTTTAP